MKPPDSPAERRYRLLYLLLLAAGALIYLFLAIDQSIWYDEAYTLAMLRHSFPEIWSITAADVHPPLYYFLLKIVSAPFGCSVLSARICSVLPFLLILAIGGRQLRTLFDARTALLFMALFLSFPYLMTYAVEIRMYSLASLFVFLNALYALRIWRDGSWRNWAVFALSGTCAAYTHYFAMVSAGVVYGLLLAAIAAKKRRLLPRWTAASALTVLLYLPWLACFVRQLAYKAAHEYWIKPLTPRSVLDSVWSLFSSKGVYGFAAYVFACYGISFLCLLLRKNRGEILLALSGLAVPAGTALVGIAASLLVRPVFIIRYLVPSIPVLLLSVAYAVGKIRSSVLASVLLTALFMGGAGNFSKSVSAQLHATQTGLDSLFPGGYGFVDACVACGTVEFQEHLSGVLSYYEPSIPIYVMDETTTVSPASPFSNVGVLQSFHPEEHASVVVFLMGGYAIPEALRGFYEHQYVGTVNQYGKAADAFLLTRVPPGEVLRALP